MAAGGVQFYKLDEAGYSCSRDSLDFSLKLVATCVVVFKTHLE